MIPNMWHIPVRHLRHLPARHIRHLPVQHLCQKTWTSLDRFSVFQRSGDAVRRWSPLKNQMELVTPKNEMQEKLKLIEQSLSLQTDTEGCKKLLIQKRELVRLIELES